MVRTTPEERQRIRDVLAGMHNALFQDDITADDITLTQLTSYYNEADVYFPYFGINIGQWRDWSPEKKMEVLLHEFAHVENHEDNHRPPFWERFVDLVEIAEEHQAELEQALDADIDMQEVRERIIDSVHEGTVDLRMDSVQERKQWLRDRLL